MNKRTPTTKDIALLKQLHDQGQLALAPEFQRNSIWPRAAKAYLIDTILNDRPIPLLFFQRISSAQTGRSGYAVIDGQQRLRAIFEFLDDRFKLSQSDRDARYYNKKFSQLEKELQDEIQDYDLVVQELTGYSDEDIKDIFIRMNKYVVKLSPQELRHARAEGKFSEFVERLGKWDFWKIKKVISAQQLKRMRAVEFVAELAILLIEGPQDKKSAIDLYYVEYTRSFGKGAWVETLLKQYLAWIEAALPEIHKLRYRSPTDLYSLIGALHDVSEEGSKLNKIDAGLKGKRLIEFARKMKGKNPTGDAARYLTAASRQTDNIQPRTTRIEIISKLLMRA
jgi:Protein of unknown function DUF262